MNEQPVDFSSLSTAANADAWEARLQDTMQRLAPALAERAATANVFDYLAIWTRPALACAAVMTVLAVPVVLAKRQIDPGSGADGMAVVTRVWAAGGPQPNGAQLVGVVERKKP